MKMNLVGTKYTLETLVEENMSYASEHNVKESDVEKANNWITFISDERTDFTPCVGDRIRYTNEYGNYYANAHIESICDNGDLRICEQPYTPFVYKSDENKLGTSTSGGAWGAIPSNLKCIGVEEKYFTDWGHCGPAGNGAIQFKAKVLVWEYSENKDKYSTKTHDKFNVCIIENEEDRRSGYKYLISKNAMSSTAFRTDEEYEAWLQKFNGVEATTVGDRRTVWTYKQKEVYNVSEEEFNALEGTLVEVMNNGRMQPAKMVTKDTTITTYILSAKF